MTTASLGDAQQLLADHVAVATLVGTLRDRVQAADVDPADTGAEPEAGIAASEELVSWCERHGVPWLLRASGRAGGRHVIAVVPDDLAEQWPQLCQRVRDHHGVGVGARRTLRLLQAPHRWGFEAPVLAGTLTASDLPQPSSDAESSGNARRPRRRARRSRKRAGVDRSAREFGDALARVRAGWSAGRAWAAADVPGSKAREWGEPEWRRWVWCRAVTVVAAERHVSEPEAWRAFRRASAARARQLGLEGWRHAYWLPALEEARRDRPRRVRTDRTSSAQQPSEAEQRELDLVRTGLRTAADQQVQAAGRRPQFARSLAAALDVLAEVIVCREGSISERELAERACLDRKTVRAALQFAAERGVLEQGRSYGGGAQDSAAWRPGPVAAAEIQRLRETSTTRWYTTPAPLRGRADPTLLRRRHRREQQAWRLRCELSSSTEVTGETYRDSQHPAAKALRSLWHQRKWWTSLSEDEQEDRRAHRRELLGRLHRRERSAWFDWLNRRAVLQFAAEQVQGGRAVAADHQLLATAPRTLHLGMRDPLWRTGGTPTHHTTAAEPGEQGDLLASAA